MVVVIFPLGQTQDDLGDPDAQYDSIEDLDAYEESFCEQDFSSAKAYITAEFGGDLFPANGFFVVGGERVNAPNDRPSLYTNGFLCFGGHYTFFVRAYPQPDLPVRREFDLFVIILARLYRDLGGLPDKLQGDNMRCSAPLSTLHLPP